MKLILSEKTGFKGYGRVKVLDHRKKWFYAFYFQPTGYFNLPRGIYYTDSKIVKLYKPIKYDFTPLVKREKHRPLPKKIILKYSNNETHKGTIVLTDNVYYITIDKKYKEYPRPFRTFIKYHELGHHLYKTEEYADLFAYRLMLIRGYNPSQIYQSAHYTLSFDSSKDRIKKMFLLTKKKY